MIHAFNSNGSTTLALIFNVYQESNRVALLHGVEQTYQDFGLILVYYDQVIFRGSLAHVSRSNEDVLLSASIRDNETDIPVFIPTPRLRDLKETSHSCQ